MGLLSKFLNSIHVKYYVQRTAIFSEAGDIKIQNDMANTYTQCYFQLVFAVKNRESFIRRTWKSKLEMYITGVVQNQHHKMLAIGAMPEHIHILIGYNVNYLIPDLVEEIKTSSNIWIKKEGFSGLSFGWQKGYGAFTYSHEQIYQVINYILSQEKHHREKLFREEYMDMLIRNNIEFRDEYVFDFFDENS